MKKMIIAVGVVLILAALATPYFIGMQAEGAVRDYVALFEDTTANYRAEIVAYDRGWRSSTATIAVGLGSGIVDQLNSVLQSAPDAGDATETAELVEIMSRSFELLVDISHGPLLSGDGPASGLMTALITLPPENTGASAQFVEALQGRNVLAVTAHVGFDGNADFTAEVVPIQTDLDDGRFDFSGITGSGTFTAADQLLSFDVVMALLDIVVPAARLQLSEAGMDGEYRLGGGGPITPGNATLRVANLTVSNTAQDLTLVEMNDLAVTSDIVLQGDRDAVDMGVTYRMGALTAANVMTLDDVAVVIQLNNFDRQVVEYLQQVGDQMNLMAGGLGAPDQMMQMQATLHRFLSGSPQIDLETVEFRYNGEPVRGNLDIRIAGERIPGADAFNLFDVATLLGTLSATSDLSMSKAVAQELAVTYTKNQMAAQVAANPDAIPGVEPGADGAPQLNDAQLEMMARAQAPNVLNQFVALGFIRDEGDSYAVDLEFSNLSLVVNDRPFPLPLAEMLGGGGL